MPYSKLTPDQTSIRNMARKFAQQEVLPVAWYYDEQDYIPLDVLKRAFDAGIINADIPPRYGGRGYRLLDIVMMIEEITAACPGIALSIFENSLSIVPLMLCTNEALKERYLKDFAASFRLICFAASEPVLAAAGSGSRCRAERKGDGYVLNGTKWSVTNGGIADYMSVFADTRTDAGDEGIGAFLVNLDSPGVSVRRPKPRLGQRSSHAAGIHFKDVFVPADAVMAPPHEGLDLALRTFNRIRPMIGAFAVGAARSAMEFAADHADRHRNMGVPEAVFETIEVKIADMQQKLSAAQLLTWKSAWEIDKHRERPPSPSAGRLYELTWALVNDAMQIFGGYGYNRRLPDEKMFRDIRLLRIQENISEIQRIVLAGAVMNRPWRMQQPSEWTTGAGMERFLAPGSGLAVWHCRTCGNDYYGRKPRPACPFCFFPKKVFTVHAGGFEERRVHYRRLGEGGGSLHPDVAGESNGK